MIKVILQEQKQNNSVWIRNTIECPFIEYIRHATAYRLSSINYFGDMHDSFISFLYRIAQRETPIVFNGIKGKIDAIDGDKLIEHKRITVPLHQLFSSPTLLMAIANGIKEIYASFLPISPFLHKNRDINAVVNHGCEDKYPFSIGCVVRHYFDIELYAKIFYEMTNKLVSDPLYTLLPEEFIALDMLIKSSRQQSGYFSIEALITGAMQAKVYKDLYKQVNGKDLKPFVSITITPKHRLLPTLNIELDVSDIPYTLDNFMQAVEIVKNPKKFTEEEIKNYKNKRCSSCDLRSICPFRKKMEKYDEEIKNRNIAYADKILKKSKEESIEVLLMKSP
jgi:hypothetical protein